MLKFDEDNLRDVAEVVIQINPSAEGMEVEYLMAKMRANAIECFEENNNFGYLSTYGYVLTLYNDPWGNPSIKASVNVYTVKTFLEDNRYRLTKKAA